MKYFQHLYLLRLGNTITHYTTTLSPSSLNVPIIIMKGFDGLGSDGDMTMKKLINMLISLIHPVTQFVFISLMPARIAAQVSMSKMFIQTVFKMQKPRELIIMQREIWSPYDEDVSKLENNKQLKIAIDAQHCKYISSTL
jgi:hypothetical protein